MFEKDRIKELEEMAKVKKDNNVEEEVVREERLNTHIRATAFKSIRYICYIEDMTIKRFVNKAIDKAIEDYLQKSKDELTD